HLQDKYDHGQAKCPLPVPASVTIVAPRHKRPSYQQRHEQQDRQDVSDPVSLFLLGFRRDHAPWLVPFARQGKEHGLTAPGRRLSAKRTVRPRPLSGPGHACVARTERGPFRLRGLQLGWVQFGCSKQRTPIGGGGRRGRRFFLWW